MSKTLASRRRNTPWIQRWSRQIIGAIATLGILDTAYLTYTKLADTQAVCPTSGCEKVLSSPWASVYGIPLPLIGLLGYSVIATLAFAPLAVRSESNKQLRTQLENWTWLFLFIGTTAMTVFSGYLMFIMTSQFVVPLGWEGVCFFCVFSALTSLSLFVLTLIGRDWEDIGQLLFVGVIVIMVTLIGTLAIYAPIQNPAANSDIPGEVGPAVTTTSGNSEIQLAQHLKRTGAKMYGAYWCSHCYDQKLLFGAEASKELAYIECYPGGRNAQPEVCEKAGVRAFPTWEINGQLKEGTIPLEELAKLSGYTGPRDFQNN